MPWVITDLDCWYLEEGRYMPILGLAGCISVG